ncbi:monovalent cation/H(+) antiporter subunit G [Mycetocola zhadangensis]|uniref:Monovalent cation/H(+) antiporter subunit G n=1 Tax=Mycetocola zhadangensis TaxID=1164595 RepID=A0A3L7J4W2_9MICO|nr:monovalent cation/H(+) antiporter subunit G [Mycetocola zhadangensis]RLQ85489.1 monovalent cation/H(+) antiporter subunit G [Mycetocola zhadangensis]GGE83063.1 Na+/H+ antiporter subunit G [Mycetocola zhadangensis]
MTGDGIREIITITLVMVAALMSCAAGIGLFRFPDVLSRLHAATKPQILGLMCACAAVAVNTPRVATFLLMTAIIIFQGLTAPITAHMVARAAYRSNHLRRDLLIRDELADRVERIERSEESSTSPKQS